MHISLTATTIQHIVKQYRQTKLLKMYCGFAILVGTSQQLFFKLTSSTVGLKIEEC